MTSPTHPATAPHVDTRKLATETEVLAVALVLVWSSSEPHRVAEITFPSPFVLLWLGRGDNLGEPFTAFFQHRPGMPIPKNTCAGSIGGKSVSGRQVQMETKAGKIEIKVTGGCLTLVNGVEVPREGTATLKPGDTLYFMGEALFLCVLRQRRLPDLPEGVTLHPFGEAGCAGMVGESAAYWKILHDLADAAHSPYHVFIRGQSGSGKEMAAAVIHRLSQRAGRPLIVHNAAVFTESLLEQQLFGSLPGYPTPGAPAFKGLFRRAEGGTLFLDEIGDCPAKAQAAILRIIEGGGFEVMGEEKTRRGDIRIVAATNLGDETLRKELVSRLDAQVQLPPIGDRREDIPLLIRAIMLRRAVLQPAMERFIYVGPTGRREVRISGTFVDQLVRHPLTNNIRDISRLLYGAVRDSKEDTIRPAIPPQMPSPSLNDTAPTSGPPSTERMGKPTKEELVEALKLADGKVLRVADAWGRSRSAVYRMMKEYGIERGPEESE